jgi:hypothetical protein
MPSARIAQDPPFTEPVAPEPPLVPPAVPPAQFARTVPPEPPSALRGPFTPAVPSPPPSPSPSPVPVPPAQFAPEASATAPIPVFTPNTWTIVIGSDRDYYDRMQHSRNPGGPPVAFPEHGGERMVTLTGKQMRIGRRSAARSLRPEIDLADPPTDPGVSRLHAVFIATADGTWAVLDPGSANGTLLNGREIPVGDLVPLRDGDRINLGAWTVITVRRG